VKVKVGDLKTHLSRYLRTVDETGLTLEVCVRDETVAYLVPANAKGASVQDADRKLRQHLSDVNLRWDPAGSALVAEFNPHPVMAGDGRPDVVTTDAMRSASNW